MKQGDVYSTSLQESRGFVNALIVQKHVGDTVAICPITVKDSENSYKLILNGIVVYVDLSQLYVENQSVLLDKLCDVSSVTMEDILSKQFYILLNK